MNLFRVDFLELYERHLRRHSQFGINVLHLVSVAGIYLSFYAIAFALPGAPWTIVAALSAYFLLLSFNIPACLLVANAIFVALLGAIYWALPPINVWIYVALIPVWHRFQIWNHKVYDRHFDMSRFAAKYPKGPTLFLLLSIYEAPILLHYLIFDRRRDAILAGRRVKPSGPRPDHRTDAPPARPTP